MTTKGGTSGAGIGLGGKVVVVTGATGNLGRAAALALGAAGARLALVGRDPESLAASFRDHVDGSGKPPAFFAADLTDAEQTAELARQVVARLGRIDAVAHTAGAFKGGQGLLETPIETLDAMLRLNLWTAFAVARATLPAMLERGGGSLTLVAARAGLHGRPGLGAYCAAKSGVIRLVESLAQETAGTGVRVNCVLPEAIAPPGGGAGTAPEAIAAVLAFLASDAAVAVTGAAVPV